jgi:lysozyme
MKPQTKTSLWKSSFFKKITKKHLIIFFLVLLFIFLPVFWNSRINWKFEKAYGIRLPLKYTIHGIDVSHHQSNINWDKVSKARSKNAKISFCFIKASEGVSLADQDFNLNWTNSKKHGIKHGAYHFYIPWANANEQANQFLSKVSFTEGDLLPVLDFEIEGGKKHWPKMNENVKIWLDKVEKKCGKKPIIYTNKSMYKKYIKGNFDEYPLWIADYKSSDLNGYNEANKLILWQHSQAGKVAGIAGDVDFNVFLGTENEFKEICL